MKSIKQTKEQLDNTLITKSKFEEKIEILNQQRDEIRKKALARHGEIKKELGNLTRSLQSRPQITRYPIKEKFSAERKKYKT